MKSFFSDAVPKQTVTHGEATFDLPIHYFRDDLFVLYYTADYAKVKAAMPSDNLHPLVFPGGKAIAAIFAFNYIDTAIGPYGEIGVGLPAVFGKPITAVKSLAAALLESNYPGFGVVVMHLPVTGVEARDAGRGEWGYTKFIADMHFSIAPEYLQCRMLEGDEHILDIHVKRKGVYIRDKKPQTTYSVLNGNLVKTVIPQQATKRIALMPSGSYVKLGNHPMADSIRDLGLSARPFMSFYCPERPAILPSGEIIEKGVRPMDGYLGKDRTADHTVEYPA